jgi:diadenosine tetraphosphate (Ap4A) HIT family hydrolase
VLLRPAQPTLGSFVLVAKSEARSFPDLPEAAFAELQDAVADIEDSLSVGIRHERINYLMLMMVDPHVHFHVIPRYEDVRSARGVTVIDVGWPKMPALDQAVELKPAQIAALVEHFQQCWPQ